MLITRCAHLFFYILYICVVDASSSNFILLNSPSLMSLVLNELSCVSLLEDKQRISIIHWLCTYVKGFSVLFLFFFFKVVPDNFLKYLNRSKCQNFLDFSLLSLYLFIWKKPLRLLESLNLLYILISPTQ